MPFRYFDIGVNLTDHMFAGHYRSHHKHPSDIPAVLTRAATIGVRAMLITGSCLEESRQALRIASDPNYATIGTKLYTTAGLHPCMATEMPQNPSSYLQELRNLILDGKSSGTIKAFGELGLDYDRLHFADKETQKHAFHHQLLLASSLDLPLFLHSRAAHDDFLQLLKPVMPQLRGKLCVHSFTGTKQEVRELLDAGFYISVNGCSFKTEETLEAVREIPLERLLLETDAPWCEVRGSSAGLRYLVPTPNEYYSGVAGHAGHAGPMAPFVPFIARKAEAHSMEATVKSRNEPCNIGLVAQVMAGLHGVSGQELTEKCYRNSLEWLGMEAEEVEGNEGDEGQIEEKTS